MRAETVARIFLFVFGLFLVGLAFYVGISFRTMGTTLYISGFWSVTAGICSGFRKRYVIVAMTIGVILTLAFWFYREPLAEAGLGIIAGSVIVLFGKKPRPSPPRPPWMAMTLVSILTLGMLSPIGTIHHTMAGSAKFEVHISDTGEIEYLLGDNYSYYDILIQDNKSLVQYKLAVEGELSLHIDGNEYSFSIERPASLSPGLSPGVLEDEPNFWWDSTLFIRKIIREVKYPHPDREYYGIDFWSDWYRFGARLLHYQINKDLSDPLASVGITAICTVLGLAVGSLINVPFGTTIGTIAGIVFGFVLTWAANSLWKDEEGCIWWWVNKVWLRWLYHAAPHLEALWISNPSAAVGAAMASFMSMGYLRVGTVTFADFQAIGSPGDSEKPDSPAVMWWGDFYLFKPGTRVCYYLASANKEWIEDKTGPANAWPEQHG